jgi:hypothetical protein
MMLEYYYLLLLLLLLLLLSRIPTHRNIAQHTPGSPIMVAAFAIMARLCEAVFIVLAEFSVEGLTASNDLLIHWWWLFSDRRCCYGSWRAACWANSSRL